MFGNAIQTVDRNSSDCCKSHALGFSASADKRWHCQGNTQWPKHFVGHAERSLRSRGRLSPRRRTAVSKTLRRCPLHSLRSRGRLSSRYLHTRREKRNQKNSTRCPRAGHRLKLICSGSRRDQFDSVNSPTLRANVAAGSRDAWLLVVAGLTGGKQLFWACRRKPVRFRMARGWTAS
jgi:hypothetical protein